MQINSLLQDAAARLSVISRTPRLDAELLLCHVLNKDREYVFAYPEKTVSHDQYQQWQALLAKRQQQIPVAYLIGQKEFWGLMLEVNEHTLIPRPETELLVSVALQQSEKEQRSLSCLDLGAGSGAIACALATEKPYWKITATDVSFEALEVAKRNAEKNNILHITFIKSDWFSNINEKFDIIVSNPPYLASDDLHLLNEDIRHEPRDALVADKNGLADITEIISQAPEYLKSDGCLLIEHGYEQGEQVRALFMLHGYQRVETFRDLGGLERVTIGY